MTMISQLEKVLQQFGLDVRKGLDALFQIPYFVQTARSYAKASRGSDFPLYVRNMRPMLNDRNSQAGYINNIYFFQDIWAARHICAKKPTKHTDIGSSIEGFVAHVLCFMPIDVIDIRPLRVAMPGLNFIQEDATVLSRFSDNSLESISSLHAVEHFGLGRYGDPLGVDSYVVAMHSLVRVLMPGGRLYFSVPIGRQRVQFNSQRIFDPLTIVDVFADLRLLSFSAVNDLGEFIEDADPKDFRGLKCGCGMFEFTK